MKFGKRLKQQIDESLPEWRDKYLSYKKLKKLLKLISSAPPAANDSGKAEAEFMYLLNSEIEKFNAFFMEQEEDFVIRHKELAQRIKKAMEKFGESEEGYKEHMNQIRKDSVDFHGEMVLLINYSNINYTGVAKILKKYEKRSGGVLRLPFIQKVVQQPFFRTELISKLAKEWEGTIESAFPPSDTATGSRPAVEGIFRNTVAALLTMQEMRRGSSTYTHFSLPPLHIPDFDHVLQSLHPLPLSPIQIP